jgi:hypothetical protein
MPQIKTELLFDLALFGRPNNVGVTPYGSRRFVQVTGGSYQGKTMRGEVLPAGADIALIRSDGVFEPNVNLLLKDAKDDALVHVTYHGRFHGPDDVMRKLLARDPGVMPGDFYLWNAVFFETAAARLSWLNGILAISTGMPQAPTELGIGMLYHVYRVL